MEDKHDSSELSKDCEKTKELLLKLFTKEKTLYETKSLVNWYEGLVAAWAGG